MNKKAKKILFFTGLGVDVAITIFLFVVSIIMIATMPNRSNMTASAYADACRQNGPLIGFLQQNPTVYLLSCVIPLFALLALNIVVLVLYVRKLNKKKEMAVDDLSEEQKAALRAELLNELQNVNSADKELEDK